MTYNLETIKQIIQTFVEESAAKSVSVRNSSGAEKINRSIFDIESYLVEVRTEHGVNQKLDTGIVSENILSHFSSTSAWTAYRPSDYQLNFLYHLAVNYKSDSDLHHLVDEFIIAQKEELTLADIVITKTGGTRCKTNTRFALDKLRELGLVLSRDKNNKRTWSPSMMGLVALLNIKMSEADLKSTEFYKTHHSLKPLNPKFNQLPGHYNYDPTLIYALTWFKDPSYLYQHLDQQKQYALSNVEKDLLSGIMNDFINFTVEGLEITPSGIKETKLFKELSNTFQQKLFKSQEDAGGLMDKLFAHFREKNR